MRYVAKDPFANGSLIRIAADGKSYDILAEQPIPPTSELPSHLLMHNFLRAKGRDNRVVLHTHPTDIIGMTHCKPFLDSEKITRTLWSMIPECRIIVPKGVGIVPYEIPGTLALAHATIRQLEEHDVVFWEKHGILAVGEDLIECFDVHRLLLIPDIGSYPMPYSAFFINVFCFFLHRLQFSVRLRTQSDDIHCK